MAATNAATSSRVDPCSVIAATNSRTSGETDRFGLFIHVLLVHGVLVHGGPFGREGDRSMFSASVDSQDQAFWPKNGPVPGNICPNVHVSIVKCKNCSRAGAGFMAIPPSLPRRARVGIL